MTHLPHGYVDCEVTLGRISSDDCVRIIRQNQMIADVKTFQLTMPQGIDRLSSAHYGARFRFYVRDSLDIQQGDILEAYLPLETASEPSLTETEAPARKSCGCMNETPFLSCPRNQVHSSGTTAQETFDSGEDLKQFESGAIRSKDADHARYDLIPRAALEAMTITLKKGADRYGEFNWKKGIPASDLMNHCLQHIYKWLDGDRSEEHIAHAMCNLAFLAHFETEKTKGEHDE